MGISSPQPGSEGGSRLTKGERTRLRILGAAEAVFGEMGYHDASIVEITSRSDVALGTFYVHFPSKKAIFDELARVRRKELFETVAAATAGVENRRDRERIGLRAYFAWIAEHPAMYRIARQAEFVDPVLHREWYEVFARAYARSLKDSMDRGEIPKTDPDILSWSVMGMSDFIAMRFMLWEGGRALPPETLEAFLDVAMRALGFSEDAG